MTDTLEPATPPPAPSGDEPAVPPPVAAPSSTGPLPGLALVAGTLALGVFVNWWIVVVILALVVSILLHELGHFLAAKRSGMKVTEFFLGMGPRIWAVQRGETTYGVKAFPVGAYVRIVGMNNLEHVDPADEDRTYRSKGYLKRLGTVLAGPAMNLLIAFVVLYAVVVTSGSVDLGRDTPGDGWVVGRVVAGSSAAEAGLQPGDEIVSMDGVDIAAWDDFGDVVDDLAGQSVDIAIVRDGEAQTLTTTLGWSLEASAAEAIPSTPALEQGMVVTAVGGEPVTSYDDLRAALAAVDEPTELALEAGDDRFRLEVLEPVALPDDGARGFFGVGPEAPSRSVGPLEAVPSTASALWEQATGTVSALGQLFSPSGLASYTDLVVDSTTEGSEARLPETPTLERVSVEGDAEPVATVPTDPRPISILGIVQIGGDVGAQQGLVSVLVLLASVNLVLGLLNLLPLLPFDGGHAAVATYEAIRGAIARRPYRVDIAKLMPLTYGVVIVLLFIGLTSMWLDIRNPIQIP